MQFPKEGVQFLSDLKANNNREWFNEHKSDFEKHVKAPSSHFADALSELLAELAGGPIEHKIFRIYRDVRFSKDKTPYNTHVRIGFWQPCVGTQKPLSGPAFYLSIEADALYAGAGCMAMPPEMLIRYRDHVATSGDKLAETKQALEKDGMRFDPPALKRVPSGFDKDHPHVDLLRYKGISAWRDTDLGEPSAVDAEDCMSAFESAFPIYEFVRTFA